MRCWEKGGVTKGGTPCNYPVAPGYERCPHHDGSNRAKIFQEKGSRASQMNRLPRAIQMGKLATVEEIRQTYCDLLDATMTQKHLERSRVDLAVKILAGASNLLQVDAMKELSDILRTVEGQGSAVLVLNSLKQARRRPLPMPTGQEVRHGA